MHLFAFSHGDERYDEGKTIEAGTEPVAFEARAAASACRCATTCAFRSSIAAWASSSLIVVPSAFTAVTGAAHWHVLLRARAIENQCYVLAAAQGGLHPGGRRTYGHSLLIDPWGVVLAERKTRARASSSARSNAERLAQVRRDLPALRQRSL